MATAEVARTSPDVPAVEQALIQSDLSKLTSEQRIAYYRQVCESLGLNPLTQPFNYITLNGKLTLYARRDATEQLRRLHHVSITIVSREQTAEVYVVTARASMPDGRADESTGAVSIAGLKGEALANAFMKCETKAKRRVTLSIVGLGWLDESEVADIPGASHPAPTVPAIEHHPEPAAPSADVSHTMLLLLTDQLAAVETPEALHAVAEKITAEMKRLLLPDDLAELREAYREAEARIADAEVPMEEPEPTPTTAPAPSAPSRVNAIRVQDIKAELDRTQVEWKAVLHGLKLPAVLKVEDLTTAQAETVLGYLKELRTPEPQKPADEPKQEAPAPAPAKQARPKAPTTGVELMPWLAQLDRWCADSALSRPGELIAEVKRAGEQAANPLDMGSWDARTVSVAVEFARKTAEQWRQKALQKVLAANNGTPVVAATTK